MTIADEMRKSFQDTPIGNEFTTAEIKNRIYNQFGRNPGSVIPTDYCYNRYNHGIDFSKQLKLFEYTSQKTFRYLGENYPYTGKVYHKPKGGNEICLGEFVNGVQKSVTACETVTSKNSPQVHKTKREVSLQLRYKVLKRDNFKCCFCGASPAKNPAVELHIDHIIPWSKGGETLEENLQTLCSECNLGKSNCL